MLKLSDFFQPLNLVNFLYTLFLLVFFDVLGTLVKSFFVKDKQVDSETRLINWLMGFGFFIFGWFILGFFVVPTQLNLQISILVLFMISLPYYFKERSYHGLFKLGKPLIFPIILVLPLLYPTFVKASLPPYVWDEMAYHFISPYTVLHEITRFWHLTGNLYENLPRLMDTFYILIFSLTRTYSVARFIQFLIFVTAVFGVFLAIKKLFGRFPAILFALLILSLTLKIPSLTTVGYVDMPALSFLGLGLAYGIISLFTESKEYLILSAVFWAMSVGTKYTTVTSLAAFSISYVAVLWIKNKSFKFLIDKKTLVIATLGLIIFGGYWYIKNFVAYGNPIYPFLFHCWGSYAQNCGTGASFFGTWTTQININTFYPIIAQLLPYNFIVRLVLFLSPFLLIIFGSRQSKLALLMLSLSFGIELLVLSNFSGFDVRYQRYLMFTLILIVVLFVSEKFESFTVKLVKYVFVTAVVISSIYLYFQNVVLLYSADYLSRNQIDYATGRVTIDEWITSILPDVSETIFWCDNPPDGPVGLARFDPDMIWYSYSGMMRIYLTGCYYDDPVLKPGEWKDIANIAKERKLRFWTVSINPCTAADSPKLQGGDVLFRELNNAIVCNSTEVVPALYYFDYQKLK